MEVYGEKPKRFSQKWWENYFYYYKVHTIVAIVTVFVLGYIIYSDVTSTKYDLQIDYISELGMSQDQADFIAASAKDNIQDATGNGVCDVFVLNLDMQPSNDMQYAQAMQVKYMTEQVYSDAIVFIVSQEYAKNLSGVGIFEDASVWAGHEYQGEFVSLADCTVFDNTLIPADNLLIGVRKLREDELDNERKIMEYENGIMYAKYLIDKRVG